MSNLSDIMGGIETTLEGNVTGLKCYKYLPATLNHFPATIIIPDGLVLDPEQAFGGNSFQFSFRLRTFISSNDEETGWTQLVEMMDPTTANKSIIKAIRTDPGLNGKADTSGITRLENVRHDEAGFSFDAILEGYKSVA